MSDNDKTIKKKDTVEKEEPEITGKEKNVEKETKDTTEKKSMKKTKTWQKSVEDFFLFWN